MADPDAYDFYCEVAIPGKEKLDIVYESDNVLAFHHTKPSYEEHIVVVPKEHIKDVVAMEDDELLTEIMNTCKKIMKGLDFEKKGGRIVTNLGKFQDTPHVHFHVIAGRKIR